jgi:hypothetical protein
MKLEMGESLVFSWLKHEKHCQLVQTNWKMSKEWSAFASDASIEKIYQASKKFFKQIDIDFVSKKVKKSNQLILQGEVDVIGIELDLENQGKIKAIHAVDVAFHEAGLNYGGKEETEARLIKKYIRTALSIYKYFGAREANIYFVTPHSHDNHRETYVNAKKSVSDFFSEQGFRFSFHFYSNDDFYEEIFRPVERISGTENDTSELFVRAMKLKNLMGSKFRGNIKATDIIATGENGYIEERKIGQIIRDAFDNLSESQSLSEEMIACLSDAAYSKKTFGLNFALLIDNEDDRIDEKGYSRYYSAPYSFNGKEYFLCSQWFEKHKDDFVKWYNALIQMK